MNKWMYIYVYRCRIFVSSPSELTAGPKDMNSSSYDTQCETLYYKARHQRQAGFRQEGVNIVLATVKL